MALPLVLLGLIPAAAYAGKKLYDSLTEDEKPTKKISYHTTTTPNATYSKEYENIKNKQREQAYIDFTDSLIHFLKSTDDIVFIHSNDSEKIGDGLLAKVRRGELSPEEANEILRTLQVDKDRLSYVDSSPSKISQLMNPRFSSFAGFLERLNSLDIFDGLHAQLREDYTRDYKAHLLAPLLEHCCAHDMSITAPLPDANIAKYWPTISGLWESAYTYSQNQDERNWPVVVTCGLLKAGKSSLLNCLIEDRTNETFKVGPVRTTIKNQYYTGRTACFIDTPGLDANSDDTKEAEKAYAEADVLLFVHNGEREFLNSELDFLKKICAQYPYAVLSVIITNRFIAGDDAERFEKKIREQLEGALNFKEKLYYVDNHAFQKSFLPGKEKLRAISGIDSLREDLLELCSSGCGAMKEKKEKFKLQVCDDLKTALLQAARSLAQEEVEQDNRRDTIFTAFINDVVWPGRKTLDNL